MAHDAPSPQSGRAQGTIEYLVIIAVVVVIALVVVSLLVSTVSPLEQTATASSQIAAKTQAVALTEGIIGQDGTGVLSIKNNTGDTITINSISFDEEPATGAENTTMPLGDEKTFTLTGITACTGNNAVRNVVITYTSGYGIQKTESLGQVTLGCEASVVAAQPSGGGGGAVCGNNIIDGTDDCDGTAPITATCLTLGFTGGGTPTCLPTCDYNTATCYNAAGINLSAPTTGWTASTGYADFNYTLDNITGITDCNLYINSSPAATTTTGFVIGTNRFTNINIMMYATSSDTNYNWDVNCTQNGTKRASTNGPRKVNWPSIYLSSAGAGNFRYYQGLIANTNPTYAPAKVYKYSWYKGTDLNATTLITYGLVGYWPLNGNINDYSGNGHNGTCTANCPTSAPSAGKIGGAYSFNGSSKWINVADSGGNFSHTQQTVAAWIYPTDLSSDNYFIAEKMTHDSVWEFWLMESQGKKLTIRGGSTSALVGNTALQPNRWYFVVATWDGGTGKVYLDGVLDGSGGITPVNSSAGDMLIGTDSRPACGGCGEPFNGYIDEFEYYSRALSLPEIQQLYYGGLYDGNKMNGVRLAAGDTWKASYQYKAASTDSWSPDKNSAPVTITAGSIVTTGGNLITTDGTNVSHIFTSSGTFVVSGGSISAEVLIVAGGGGAGGGGGGAGGLVYHPAYSLSATSHSVTIGTGGGSRTAGGDSTFDNGLFTAKGGGGGYAGCTPTAGGSGAGGCSNSGGSCYGGTTQMSQSNPSGSQNFGNPGGANDRVDGSPYSTGGGGGAGAAGAAGSKPQSGAGGIGKFFPQFAYAGGSPAGWFAGGGGGGAGQPAYGGVNALGGLGGGGDGGPANYGGTSAIPGTGGGGGGQGYGGTDGSGGSGVVIVRYIAN